MRRWAIGILMFGLAGLVFVGSSKAGWVYIPNEETTRSLRPGLPRVNQGTTVIERYGETRWNSAGMAVPLGYDYGSSFDAPVLYIHRRPTRYYRCYRWDEAPRRIVRHRYHYDYPCYEAPDNRMTLDVSDKVLGTIVLWKIYDEVARHNDW